MRVIEGRIKLGGTTPLTGELEDFHQVVGLGTSSHVSKILEMTMHLSVITMQASKALKHTSRMLTKFTSVSFITTSLAIIIPTLVLLLLLTLLVPLFVGRVLRFLLLFRILVIFGRLIFLTLIDEHVLVIKFGSCHGLEHHGRRLFLKLETALLFGWAFLFYVFIILDEWRQGCAKWI